MRRVLVLGGNHDQVPYLKELRKQNFWVALSDANNDAPGISYANVFEQVGYDDIPGLINFARKLNFTTQDSIFTAAAQFAQIGAAHVAQNFGIVYPSPSIIKICLDKLLFYSEFQKHLIPIPPTKIIKTANELDAYKDAIDPLSYYYLKSDFSKNPKYIYRFKGEYCNPSSYYWGSDRYLQNAYVLQKEFIGRHLRLNLMPGRFVFYDFKTNKPLSKIDTNNLTSKFDIIDKLRAFLISYGLDSWLIKFDIIVNDSNWCALDIGLDPPSRMCNTLGDQNFANHYVNQYLMGKITYPEIFS